VVFVLFLTLHILTTFCLVRLIGPSLGCNWHVVVVWLLKPVEADLQAHLWGYEHFWHLDFCHQNHFACQYLSSLNVCATWWGHLDHCRHAWEPILQHLLHTHYRPLMHCEWTIYDQSCHCDLKLFIWIKLD